MPAMKTMALLRGEARSVEKHLTGVLGYSEGPPRGMTAEALAVDIQIATGEPCEECGSFDTRLACFHRTRPHSYKAFKRCAACPAMTEF
jgi:hypothetical protein